MTKYEDFKDNMGEFRLIEFYKSLKPIALVIMIPLFPAMILAKIAWVCVCSGFYLGELMIKDDL